jgi:predicted DNA-binding WGR domain protein
MAGLNFELYRFTNPDHSTKDWAVRDNGDGTYTSRWGKTGTRLQSKTFNKNMLSMNEHIRSKTNKGYRLIGEVLIDDDGKIASASQTSKPQGQDPHPTQDELCIYWRVKIKQTSLADTQAIGTFQLNALSMSKTIQSLLPDHEWIKGFSEKIVKDQLPLSGKLFKEFGVSSLLLFMAMMKVSPDQISIHLSHDDGVEISSQIKLEPKALSLFDTDLESVRPVAEELGLIEKRIDLSIIASSQDDFYF